MASNSAHCVRPAARINTACRQKAARAGFSIPDGGSDGYLAGGPFHNRRLEAAFDRKTSVQPSSFGTTRHAQGLSVVAIATA